MNGYNMGVIGLQMIVPALFAALGILLVLWVLAKAIVPLIGVVERIVGWWNGF